VGDVETKVPAWFHWLVWPMEHGSPKVREFLGKDRVVCVKAGSRTDTVVVGPSEKGNTKDRFSTDASLAFVRQQESGDIERIILVDGSSLWSEDRAVCIANASFDHFVAEWKAGGVEIDARPLRPFRLQSPPVHQVLVNGKAVQSSEANGALVFTGEN